MLRGCVDRCVDRVCVCATWSRRPGSSLYSILYSFKPICWSPPAPPAVNDDWSLGYRVRGVGGGVERGEERGERERLTTIGRWISGERGRGG